MREREKLRSDTISAAAAFLKGEAPRHPRLARWHAKFADTERRLAQLKFDEGYALEHGGERAAWPNRVAARLRERFLLRIAASGRKILRRVAGAERALRVPPKRANPAAIADAARRLAAFLNPKARRLFVEAGFEPEFWPAFDEARTALASAIRDVAGKRGVAAKLTAQLRALIREARADMEVLSGVLEPLLAESAGMRVNWDTARRIPGVMGRPTDAKRRRRAAREARQPDSTGSSTES